MPSLRTKPSLTSLVAFFLIVVPLLYVLSYAPVVRVCDGPSRTNRSSGLHIGHSGIPADSWPAEYPLYKPVDWLIDNTPLRKPLFMWADLWNVQSRFTIAADAREAGWWPFVSSDPD